MENFTGYKGNIWKIFHLSTLLGKNSLDKFGNLVTIESKMPRRKNMSQVIRIPETLYKRLENFAQGFDTPANVIERILNYYESNCSEEAVIKQESQKGKITKHSKLEIIYHPEGVDVFKKELLEKKQAFIRLFKDDGVTETKVWNASKFKPDSDIINNLRSGYLRGWKTKGIYKAVVAINEKDLA
jgi:hypothetical protein